MTDSTSIISADAIELTILELRGLRVLLDADLARMYAVETRALLQAVRRNPERFSEDFMFQLTEQERNAVGLKPAGRGGRRGLPFAFTQEGVAMLSSVLRGERAVEVNVQIMRAFVRMKAMLASRTELANRIDELEARYDSQFGVIFDAIRQLMAPPNPPKHPVGFVHPKDP
ncbi:MAG: ORF6N domain-containing protein [Coriobacteriia bacterium]|nr:ORF6N domain-containing protein [Coriobacteriia bacterium]